MNTPAPGETLEAVLDCRVHAAYEDGLLLRIFTGCDGQVSAGGTFLRGTLDAVDPNPAGFVDRTPREVWDAAETSAHAAILAAVGGPVRNAGDRWKGGLICAETTPQKMFVLPAGGGTPSWRIFAAPSVSKTSAYLSVDS
jgi:hypothetical protein